jgi:hypothetical protein
MRGLLLVFIAALGLAGSPVLAQQVQPAETTTPTASPKPVPELAEGQVGARDLLGVGVSNGYDTIGEVSDLIVTEDGQVEAIVVDIGGFLGLGEKRVALPWNSIIVVEPDGERVVLISATREEFEGMPAFKTLERKQAEDNTTASRQDPTPGAMPNTTPAASSHEDAVEEAAQQDSAPDMPPAPPPQPGNQ